MWDGSLNVHYKAEAVEKRLPAWHPSTPFIRWCNFTVLMSELPLWFSLAALSTLRVGTWCLLTEVWIEAESNNHCLTSKEKDSHLPRVLSSYKWKVLMWPHLKKFLWIVGALPSWTAAVLNAIQNNCKVLVRKWLILLLSWQLHLWK